MRSERENCMRNRVIVSSLALAAFAGSSWGDVVSFSAALPSANVAFSTPFTLSQFDPSLGTLTGATITYSSVINPTATVIDVTGAGGTYANATSKMTINFTGPDGYDASGSATAGPFSGTVAVSSSAPTFTNIPGTPGSSLATDTILAADFGDFTGAGTDSFTFASGPQTSGGSPGGANIFFGGGGSASGEATIAYTYTAVPEPASFSAIGLGSFMLLRRRRKA
jgi:hypothetical protein